MTATDEQHGQLDTGYPHALRPELHKVLTAHGIDYWVAQGLTFWNRDDGCECLAYGYEADGVPKMAVKVVGFTDPEQAIEATLGDIDATRERQGVASSNCTNSERMSDELLPYPFCGGVPIVDCGYHYDYDGGDRWYVYSADVVCSCGCTLHVDNAWQKEYVSEEHSLDFAIAAWNRRAE